MRSLSLFSVVWCAVACGTAVSNPKGAVSTVTVTATATAAGATTTAATTATETATAIGGGDDANGDDDGGTDTSTSSSTGQSLKPGELTLLQGNPLRIAGGSNVRPTLLTTDAQGHVIEVTRKATWTSADENLVSFGLQTAMLTTAQPTSTRTSKLTAALGANSLTIDVEVTPKTDRRTTYFNIASTDERKTHLTFNGTLALDVHSEPTLLIYGGADMDLTAQTTFTSSDPQIVSIENRNGVVTAVAHAQPGTALITAEVNGQKLAGTITVDGASLAPPTPLYLVSTPSGFGFPSPGGTFTINSVSAVMSDGTSQILQQNDVTVTIEKPTVVTSLGGWNFRNDAAGKTRIFFKYQDAVGWATFAAGN